MSDDDKKILSTTPVEITSTDEPMPFHWQVRDCGEGHLQIEAGDLLEIGPMFTNDEAGAIQHIGAMMVMKGMTLVGLDQTTKALVARLILDGRAQASLNLEED